MSSIPDHCPGLEKWILFDPKEESYEVEEIKGTVPSWMSGTYYVNGPASFQRGDFTYRHWLDGDGMIQSLHFSPEGIFFKNRFVRTKKRSLERERKKPLFRTFGTSFPGDRLRRGLMLEPTNNVSVYSLGQRLLAFGEQALPIELDPRNLESLGEFDFKGKLSDVTPFSAHPKFAPQEEYMVNFGVNFSAHRPLLFLYSFDPRGQLLGRRKFPLRQPYANHDMALSPHYACFFLGPLTMNFERFLREGRPVMDSLEWHPGMPAVIKIVPLPGVDLPGFEIEVEPAYALHLINAFEEGGRLCLDILQLDRPVYREYQPVASFYQTKTPAEPVRYVIDPREEKVLEVHRLELGLGADFPSVESAATTRPYDDFWLLALSKTGLPGRKFFDRLVRGSWREGNCSDRYATEKGCYLGGEPVVVSDPAGTQKIVVVQHFDTASDESSFLLFEGRSLAEGPVATLKLRRKSPPAFHACFVARPLRQG